MQENKLALKFNFTEEYTCLECFSDLSESFSYQKCHRALIHTIGRSGSSYCQKYSDSSQNIDRCSISRLKTYQKNKPELIRGFNVCSPFTDLFNLHMVINICFWCWDGSHQYFFTFFSLCCALSNFIIWYCATRS